MAKQAFGLDRSLLLILGLALALVVGTTVVALTLGDGEVASFPEDSPEAAVQAFLVALDEGDFDAAYDLLAAEYRRTVDRAEFEERYAYASDLVRGDRIAVAETDVDGDRATVVLEIRTIYVDETSYDEFERHARVALVREAGAWRLREPLTV